MAIPSKYHQGISRYKILGITSEDDIEDVCHEANQALQAAGANEVEADVLIHRWLEERKDLAVNPHRLRHMDYCKMIDMDVLKRTIVEETDADWLHTACINAETNLRMYRPTLVADIGVDVLISQWLKDRRVHLQSDNSRAVFTDDHRPRALLGASQA